MRLHELITNLLEIDRGGLPDLEIMALTADSRLVTPGALFVAIKGGEADGHRFLSDAVDRGAAAALGEEPDPGLGIPYLQTPDSRLALARLAAVWYGNPASRLIMIGVTGTDGKTTTVNLLFKILQASGIRAGMITTVNAIIGDSQIDTGLHVTTPDPLMVQNYLAQMVEAGMTHCLLEVTSHGLSQHRVGACDFDLAVITNISHEHLDYHQSFEEYRAAKARLFTSLDGEAKRDGPVKTAILNRDDPSYEYLHAITRTRRVSYGLHPNAEVFASEIISGIDGLKFDVHGPGYTSCVISPLIGEYNVANCLAAFTAAVEGLGLPIQNAVEGIASVAGIPGRMERIELGQRFNAVVDFAHTPNSLRQMLEAVRQLTDKRILTVFGSAGLRDREKRRLMAEVSLELADLTVLTAEDPRTESLDVILEEMAEGALARGGVEGVSFWRVPDRGDALRFAIRQAQPGDWVIACGKGHEQSMCFGEVEYPWDDRTAFRAALSEYLGIEGPPMPQLPTSA